MIEKLSLWWKFDGRYYHKHFIQGVKNLIKWFPTIWKDRDWDHDFIYEIIKVKLNNQAKYIGSKNRHTTAKRDSEIMLLCTKLIQHCQDDFYGMEYTDYHKSKYNFLDVEDKPGLKKLDIELISENFDEYFKKYSRIHKKVLSGEVSRFSRPIEEKTKEIIAMEIAHENQDRCRKLLFKIMEERISGWWD